MGGITYQCIYVLYAQVPSACYINTFVAYVYVCVCVYIAIFTQKKAFTWGFWGLRVRGGCVFRPFSISVRPIRYPPDPISATFSISVRADIRPDPIPARSDIRPVLEIYRIATPSGSGAGGGDCALAAGAVTAVAVAAAATAAGAGLHAQTANIAAVSANASAVAAASAPLPAVAGESERHQYLQQNQRQLQQHQGQGQLERHEQGGQEHQLRHLRGDMDEEEEKARAEEEKAERDWELAHSVAVASLNNLAVLLSEQGMCCNLWLVSESLCQRCTHVFGDISVKLRTVLQIVSRICCVCISCEDLFSIAMRKEIKQHMFGNLEIENVFFSCFS